MCAEKTDEKSKTTTNNCWEGMDEMMRNCCPGSGAIDCCAQFKEKCNSGTDVHADCMDMFQQMKDRYCGQTKDIESVKGRGCCC